MDATVAYRLPASKRPLIVAGAVMAVFLALAAAWRWSPLGDALSVTRLSELVNQFRGHPLAPLAVVLVYMVSAVLVLPMTALVIATVLAFGTALGFAYSLAGMTAAAILAYGIGHLAGRRAVQRLAGSRLGRASRAMASRGTMTVALTRMIPVAHFTLVSMVAGASHIRYREFVLGTVIGTAPSLLVIALFVDSVEAVLRNPQPGRIALLALLTLVLTVGSWSLYRWARRLRLRARRRSAGHHALARENEQPAPHGTPENR